jgi:hypothetical protein
MFSLLFWLLVALLLSLLVRYIRRLTRWGRPRRLRIHPLEMQEMLRSMLPPREPSPTPTWEAPTPADRVETGRP